MSTASKDVDLIPSTPAEARMKVGTSFVPLV